MCPLKLIELSLKMALKLKTATRNLQQRVSFIRQK